MFNVNKEIVTPQKAITYYLTKADQSLTFMEVLNLLCGNPVFRIHFRNFMAGIPFQAFQWELPPLTEDNKYQRFECTVTRNSGIDRPPNPAPFNQYLNKLNPTGVAVFDNLGSDATLIAPAPYRDGINYAHLANFIAHAPAEQQDNLWGTVGKVTSETISQKPIWLNTAGGGVAWLHIRLDSRPKYYLHNPYRKVV